MGSDASDRAWREFDNLITESPTSLRVDKVKVNFQLKALLIEARPLVGIASHPQHEHLHESLVALKWSRPSLFPPARKHNNTTEETRIKK